MMGEDDVLLMIVTARRPDTYAAIVPAVTEMTKAGSKAIMGEAAKKLGITLQGDWSNMPAHVMYILANAPNAHVVSQLYRNIRLMN